MRVPSRDSASSALVLTWVEAGWWRFGRWSLVVWTAGWFRGSRACLLLWLLGGQLEKRWFPSHGTDLWSWMLLRLGWQLSIGNTTAAKLVMIDPLFASKASTTAGITDRLADFSWGA